MQQCQEGSEVTVLPYAVQRLASLHCPPPRLPSQIPLPTLCSLAPPNILHITLPSPLISRLCYYLLLAYLGYAI